MTPQERKVMELALEALETELSIDMTNGAEVGEAAERERNTKLLIQMHERAAAQHNYYKHAAIEINRKARSQS